jgi:lipopolysaccharide transport system permease protein
MLNRQRYYNPLRPRRLIYLWDLLRSLVIRDMKLLYKRSALGIAWTMLNPLLQLAVFAVVFSGVLSVKIPNYFSFAFVGLLVWNWFQMALFQATGVITANRPLIRQPGFPPAILPVVVVMTGLVHFLIALPILMAFLLANHIGITPLIFHIPFLVLLQAGFTICLAYPLAALNVTFRDTQHILGVLLNLLFYLTPIFYALETVPTKYQLFYAWNPMVYLVEAYRSVLLWHKAPDWLPLLILGIITTVLMPLGHWIFQRQSDRFVQEL